MVTRRNGARGYEGVFVRREIPNTARGELSVPCGTMARMAGTQARGRRGPRQSPEPADIPEEAGGSPGPPELPDYAEAVLDVTERIPPGRVMTYGDIAEWIGLGGPRQVGRVMALYGGAVPWWRVVRADGRPLPGGELRALAHYREEGTPLREAPRSAEGHIPRIDMRRARGAPAAAPADDPG
jgi:alkylated DNA nucleotide flippase Atl1